MKILNSKFEILNKFEIRNSNFPNNVWDLKYCDLDIV